MAFSMTVMLLSVRNLAELPTRLYKICIAHHITSHHITSHHITSHHITSPSRHHCVTIASHHSTSSSRHHSITLAWHVNNSSDGCLSELLHSCSTVGSSLSGTEQLLAKAAAEYVLPKELFHMLLTILCTTSNTTTSLPAWYHVVLAFHLVRGIEHARGVWCRLGMLQSWHLSKEALITLASRWSLAE